jgi:16S rRNA (guanine966-N2)-methyltransferase
MRRKQGRPKQAPSGRQPLRIIGGQWRGRKLPFPDIPGLRPTPDRVRETLFNWLQPHIVNSRCLDLFAGSGALALEALSRGAATVVMVEQHALAAQRLQQHLATLGSTSGHVVQQDALAYLRGMAAERFNIVFLDPPFRQNLLAPCTALLEQQGWLTDPAWIYLETESDLDPLPLPSNWALHRSKIAGQVGYHLARREQACEDGDPSAGAH